MFAHLPVKDRIVHALTEYDRQQSSRRGFNPHALAMYFQALDKAEEMVSKGKTWECALNTVFCDHVLAVALKSIPSKGALDSDGPYNHEVMPDERNY